MSTGVRLPAVVAAGPSGTARRSCAHCRFFSNSPLTIEASISGLRSMGSGFASVRADDGLCNMHQRYLSADASCNAFVLRDLSLPD